jgi:hypothetical protein
MIPVNQTKFTFEEGNCGEACVASILEIELSEVPKFNDPSNPTNATGYCQRVRDFVSKFGYSYIDIRFDDGNDPKEFLKDCWVIATGPSPRAIEDWHRHAVVWYNGEIVHDPHPDKTKLEKIEMYGIFIKQDPSIKKR